ncbi:MAG TPA: Rieske (2Fe-2S) protein [Motilibacterales bacterium]|nr:Rieske (2Fe-2S) protein [Motilibacterales bacterium]
MDESTCTGGCGCRSMADERGSVSRRGVLAGSAAAVAALALGGCAASDDTSSPGTAPPSEPASASPSGSTPEESATPTGDGTPTGDRLAGTGDFPVGGGVVVQVAGGVVVVTHPTDTEFLAFNGRCPHQGCPVAEVNENTILCTCHGSTFNGSTGERLEGPAPTGLVPVPIEVAGGEIFLA